jgi:hypothetical protein
MNARHETTMTIDPLLEVLAPTNRSPDIHPEDDLYGFLVGSWELDVVAYPDDGDATHSTGEAHCARVLDGRAFQDVFINPERSDRAPDSPKFGNWYGTTFRISRCLRASVFRSRRPLLPGGLSRLVVLWSWFIWRRRPYGDSSGLGN